MINYCQSSAFDCPYLSCNDHCNWWLPRNFYHYYYFLEIYSNDFELIFWDLNTFTKHRERVYFPFICSFFTCCFNHSVYQQYTLFCTFPLLVNTQDESVFFLLIVLQSHCILMLSTFCTFPILSSTKKKTKSFNLTFNTFHHEI